jgi:hypothetical protein
METLKNLTLVQWIGLMVGLNSLLMGATPQLTVLLGAAAVPYIIAIATLGNGALGVFGMVVGGQSSQVRNVLAMPGVEKISVNAEANQTLSAIAIDPAANKISPTAAALDAVTKTATAVALAFLVFGAMAWPVDAMAQGRKVLTPAPRPILCDPANLLPGCKPAPDASGQTLKNVQSIIAKPLQDLANFINGDMAGAAALAVAIPNLQDGNGQACWTALAGAGAVFRAHPVPLTFQGVTDLEAIRLLNMTANQVCTNSACTQVFNEVTNLIDAAAPITVAIPSLASLCSKIPEIAVVAPMTIAAPAPAAAANATPPPEPVVAPPAK